MVKKGVRAAAMAAVAMGLVLGTRTAGTTPDAEVERVRAHLEGTLADLRRRTPPNQTPAQAAARRETLTWLAEYAERGLFPHNHVLPGETTPVFVDPHGTPCAVAYLLLRSGHADLVDEIARTNNLVRLPDLAGEPRLERWLRARGLTLGEAAAIQPSYPGDTPPEYHDQAVWTGASALVTATLAGYWIKHPERARPSGWATVAQIAGVFGHTGLLLAGRWGDRAWEAPRWTTWANGVGLVTQAVVAIVKSSDSDRPTDHRTAPGIQIAPHVSAHGVGIGIRWSH